MVVIAAAGGLALRNLADNARADLAAAVTVQVIEPNPDLRAQRGQAVVAVLQDMALVRSVRLVPGEELARAARTLARRSGQPAGMFRSRCWSMSNWCGGPALRRSPPSGPRWTDAVPGARVDAQGRLAASGLPRACRPPMAGIGSDRADRAGRPRRRCGWPRAIRSPSSAKTVEIIHLLGGTDRQITRIFPGDRAARGGLWWRCWAPRSGLARFGCWASNSPRSTAAWQAGGGLGPADWMVIAAVPLGGVLLALLTARMTIALALKAML